MDETPIETAEGPAWPSIMAEIPLAMNYLKDSEPPTIDDILVIGSISPVLPDEDAPLMSQINQRLTVIRGCLPADDNLIYDKDSMVKIGRDIGTSIDCSHIALVAFVDPEKSPQAISEFVRTNRILPALWMAEGVIDGVFYRHEEQDIKVTPHITGFVTEPTLSIGAAMWLDSQAKMKDDGTLDIPLDSQGLPMLRPVGEFSQLVERAMLVADS